MYLYALSPLIKLLILDLLLIMLTFVYKNFDVSHVSGAWMKIAVAVNVAADPEKRYVAV